jgi:hypothetical protein
MKKHAIKKLQLRKETVTTLSMHNLQRVKGGAPVTALISCAVNCGIAVDDMTVNLNCQIITVQSFAFTFEPGCNMSGFRGCLQTDWCNASFQIVCIAVTEGATFCTAC